MVIDKWLIGRFPYYLSLSIHHYPLSFFRLRQMQHMFSSELRSIETEGLFQSQSDQFRIAQQRKNLPKAHKNIFEISPITPKSK
jgi:hypothetical protein